MNKWTQTFQKPPPILRKQKDGEEKHVASVAEKSERTTAQSSPSPEPAASVTDLPQGPD